MEQFEQKFAVYLEEIKKNPLWNEKLIEPIKAAMIVAKFDQIDSIVISKKGKKLNGYNVFMMEKMPILKKEKPTLDSNTRMTEISDEWGKLTAAEKESWKDKAKLLNSTTNKLQLKLKKKIRKDKPKKLSAYQVFVSEQMIALKESA